MTTLDEKKCKPCNGETTPFNTAEVVKHLEETQGWVSTDNHRKISRTWEMKNFLAAVKFIGKIAELAESEDHHPDIHLTDYKKLEVVLSTHKIGGLSENDFILAAKINKI